MGANRVAINKSVNEINIALEMTQGPNNILLVVFRQDGQPLVLSSDHIRSSPNSLAIGIVAL